MSQNPPQIQNPPGTGRRSRRRNRNGGANSWRDVNPQFLGLTVTESAANTYTQGTGVATPVVMQMADGRALVMELLKLFVKVSEPEIVAATRCQVGWQLTRKSQTALLTLDHPDILGYDVTDINSIGARTAEATGCIRSQAIQGIDLTDGNGNGILYAGATLYIAVKGVSCTTAKTCALKVLYRLKTVNANELVGMLRD